MARPKASSVPPPLHELESEVMEQVWREDRPTTVRSVMDALNQRAAKERAYTTIMTIMRRLDAKGLLSRRRDGKTDIYSARLSRDDYLEARARAEVGALVDEFGDAALVHFARHMNRLDRKRRDQLRRLAEDG
ncbi:MAG: BlaI/MecI/CopY family transcriptional regulator [Thermoleophilaceae bacterium]|nr:BlaI/MecI/CopY family transcriptional regulator [Thermoleophilaceae bacterium]